MLSDCKRNNKPTQTERAITFAGKGKKTLQRLPGQRSLKFMVKEDEKNSAQLEISLK